MLYLSGVYRNDLPTGVGLMAQPKSNCHLHLDGFAWAADNGCFSGSWDETQWQAWLASLPVGALFATVPDVVADWPATLERFERYSVAPHPTAIVLQDGATIGTVPWSRIDAVFVGGTTTWKLSEHARVIVLEAKRRGLWAHMGRVNSLRRMWTAQEWGCDSVDGTFPAFYRRQRRAADSGLDNSDQLSTQPLVTQ